MWVRVDDKVPHHPKFIRAGPIASWLWVCGNCYCSKYLTDGFIEESIVRGLGDIPNARKHAATLVLVGLWERCDNGYRVHDYHHYNPTAEEIQQLRVVRAEQGRLGGLAKALAIRQANCKQVTKLEFSKNVADIDIDPIPSHPIPKEQEKEIPPLDDAWEDFKACYPASGRGGGFMAQQRFLTACGSVGVAVVMAGVERYAHSKRVKDGFVLGMEKWLERELWVQEPEPADNTANDTAAIQKILAEKDAERAARGR
jgi:hypothetical protein